jgi:serine/threonine protein kinase
MIPEKIGRYEIKSELGRGGMATVYRAFDPSFDREVALKILPKEFLHDPQFRERFRREIKIIAALEHPAIVPVYDAGEEDGAPYFVMRYMPGGSLTTQINMGRFSLEDAARIIERLASALAYAHQKGIIHRDLKPDNILFDDNGNAYISDFGVASLLSSNTNLTGETAVGTPAYMSPEQAQGEKVDNRSDIYGLGVIIFQMLSGQQPYKADTPMGVALKQITEPVPEILEINPDLPKETDTIIKTAMAKKKEDRYASTIELAQAFDQVAKTDPKGKPARAGSSGAGFFGNRRNLIAEGLAAVFVVVLIVAAIGLFLLKSPPAAVTPPPTAVQAATATIIASTATASASATPPATFTENFANGLADWPQFTTNGSPSDMSVKAGNGSLTFNLLGTNEEMYAYYSPRTYDNVSISLTAENANTNVANVYIICRYNENRGWYLFNIASNGFYRFLYVEWDPGKKSATQYLMADGATKRILAGQNSNQYEVSCVNQTLSLTINGVKTRDFVESKYLLTSGNVGVGAASFVKGPVQIKFDSVTIAQQ